MSNLKPYLALEASAGSGKTYALSVRYIALLFLGANPSSILTLTFTNKAAAEMKSRICEVLANLEDKDELEEIAKLVGVSKEKILAKKEVVLTKFLQEDLLISTIDAFFARILRKFSLYAGFMPDFSIENELLEEKVLKRFLALCIAKKKYESLVRFSVDEEKKVGDIFKLLENFYNKESEFEPKHIEKSSFYNPKRVLEVASELKEVIIKSGATKRAIGLFDSDDVYVLIKKDVFKKESLSEHSYFKKYFTPKMDEKFFELKDEIAKFLKAQESYLLGELSELFYIYKEAILLTNKEFSTLSFSDVTNLLFNLLKDEIKKDFLYFRLDSRCEHILIDEFQDTNIMQYKILEPLFEEVVGGVGVSEFKTLFFVGDVKQSIYRFRGGAKELFSHAKEQFGLKKETLPNNYRSFKNVVWFVNETFKAKIKGYQEQIPVKKEKGFVEVSFSDDLLEDVISKVEVLLQSGANPKDIALLTHQNKDALALKEMLSSRFEGIVFQNEATSKLLEVPLVEAVVEFLKFAYFGDVLYKRNFLSLIGKSWEDELDSSWVDFAKTPMEIISEVIQRYELFCEDFDLVGLVEVAWRYSDIESFLFECERISEEAKNKESEGVKILTIHKSKGLEFSHVIVVDRFGAKNNQKAPLIYEYDGIDLRGIYKRVSKREYFDESYKRAKEKEEALELEDSLNMHYVAFSRAKENLFVCAKEKSSVFEYLNLEKIKKGKLNIPKEEPIRESLKKAKYKIENYGKQEVKLKAEDEEEVDFFAIDYGLAVHYCLELMSRFDEKSLHVAFEATCNKYAKFFSKEILQSIYKRVQNLIADKSFQNLIEGKKLYKEQPLVYEKERKQIDLLCEDENELIIIDYKTSKSLKDEHISQVGLYKKALKNISTKEVKAYLVYLRDEKIAIIEVK